MIRVPPRGVSVCDPPLDRWEMAAKENAAKGENQTDRLKKRWRKEFLRLARDYTSSLGFRCAEAVNETLLVSGHQPSFFHHGAMYKNLLLKEAARKGMTCVFVNVDTDTCEGFPVKLPAFRDGYRHMVRRALPSEGGALYADAATDIESLKEFIGNALGDLETIPEKLFDYGKAFLKGIDPASFPAKMRDAMISLRREYLENVPTGISGDMACDVLDVPISAVCETEGFFEFAFPLLLRADETALSFNRALDAYRREHRLRTKANPFPDLEKAGSITETLFWMTKNGKRKGLFVKAVDGGVLLMPESIRVNSAKELHDICHTNGFRLWPRAVSLSIMLRLYLSDLFVHGIGGTKYDRITDALIKEVFGMGPPTFVTASRTLAAPDGMGDPSEKLSALKQELRDMGFHPERYLDGNSAMHEIALKKIRLVEAIKSPEADKKSIGKKISALNEMIGASLEPEREKLRENIAEIERELIRFNILADRELPYFLFPPPAR